jgi:DNA-directed RNA polymerase specialized sigma24 family protein
MPSDESLLRRYAETQDAQAFAQLVERHAGLVYATCLRVAGRPPDAEDAAQECFLSLVRHAKTVRSSLSGRLHTTVRDAALALAKKSRKHGAGDASMETTDKSAGEPRTSTRRSRTSRTSCGRR